MRYEQILYDVSDAVATITLNRPEKLNAWTFHMGAEVRHACFEAERDEAVRAIVVTGAGRGYCAGADMATLQALQTGRGEEIGAGGPAVPAAALDPSLPTAFRGEYSYPLGLSKPVIAAVNGIAAGLGLSYMLYYDIRVASDRARFTTVFARRGLIAEHGSAWILPRLIGTAHSCDLLFSGRTIDAAEALAVGLVNRVVPHDELLPRVREMATEMATLCSPRSLRIMKRQIYMNLFGDLESAITESDREMVACFTTDDFREGVASFLERRPPRFRGA